MQIDNDFLTTQELAKHFRVSLSTVRRLLRDGKLTAYRRERTKQNLFKLSEAEQVLRPRPLRTDIEALKQPK